MLASKVAGLRNEIRNRIAERIRDGEEPREVVNEYIDARTSKEQVSQGIMTEFFRVLEKTVMAYEASHDNMLKVISGGKKEMLEAAQKMLEKFVATARSKSNQYEGFDVIVEKLMWSKAGEHENPA